MTASLGRHSPSRLARATEALLRARLELARGETDLAVTEATRALALLESGAPWWRAKTIRILEQTGAADASMLDEAGAIERSLGI